ncbi:MAG: hypothetical protein ACXWL5_03960 [Candidatus Chromulinivorax sp.]
MLSLISIVDLQAQKNSLRCYQTNDIVRENKKYMQFVFVDEQDHCSGGYSKAYDDPGDGELFCYQNAIRIDQFQQLIGLSIQHQLTQEVVDLLDGLAEHALHKHEHKELIS